MHTDTVHCLQDGANTPPISQSLTNKQVFTLMDGTQATMQLLKPGTHNNSSTKTLTLDYSHPSLLPAASSSRFTEVICAINPLLGFTRQYEPQKADIKWHCN